MLRLLRYVEHDHTSIRVWNWLAWATVYRSKSTKSAGYGCARDANDLVSFANVPDNPSPSSAYGNSLPTSTSKRGYRR